MSDLFTADDLHLIPKFGSLSHGKELEFSLSTHENYYENSIFLNTDNEAEMLIAEGNSEIILDSNNSVSLLDGGEFSVSIENGTHDLISINGSIQLLQNDGHSLLYVEDFSNTAGMIKIETGSFTIVNADMSNFSGEPIIDDGQLFIGGVQTDYFIETNLQENVEILFRTVSQANSDSLMLGGKASNKPVETHLETSAAENESAEIFSENSIDFSGYIDDYVFSNDGIDTHFPDGISIEVDLSNIIDEIQQNNLELEIASDGNETAEMQKTEVTEESIIKVSDYVELEWQDAIEIISDL